MTEAIRSSHVPALLGPLIGFCLGVVFAWLSLNHAPDRLAAKHRGLLLVGAFGLLLYGPICGYFLAFAADWSVAYWVDTSKLPAALAFLWVLLDAAAPALGFLIAARHEQPRTGRIFSLISGPALLALALLAMSYPRLGVHATYQQFHGDFGVHEVSGTPLGYALLLLLLLLVLGVGWMVRCLKVPSTLEPRTRTRIGAAFAQSRSGGKRPSP